MKIVSFDATNKAVFKNAGLGLLFQLLIRSKGIVLLPIIVHFLSKEDLGSWLVISSSTSLIIPIITLNLFDGSGMFFSSDFENESVTRKFSTILSSVSIIILVLIIPTIIILNHLSVTEAFWLPIMIFILMSVVFKASVMLYQCYQKSKLLVIVNFIVAYSSTIVTIFIVFKYQSYWSIIIPMVAAQLIASLILFIRIYKEIKFRRYIDKHFLMKVLKVGIPLIPTYISEWLLSFIGVYMLAYFGQLAEVGSFSVLLSIAGIFLVLRTTLQFFWFSTCSNLLRSKKISEFNSIYQLIVKGYLYLIVSGITFYIFFTKDIVKLFSSAEFVFLTTPIIITVIGYSFLIFSSIYNGILYAMARTREILFSYIFSSVSIAIVSFFLIPQFRIIGVAISILIGNIILQLLLQIFSRSLNILRKIDGFLLVVAGSSVLIILTFYLNQILINEVITRILGIAVLVFYTGILVKLDYFPLRQAFDYIKKRIK
jgi:O-antigen/teichoic acid export membrane protein